MDTDLGVGADAGSCGLLGGNNLLGLSGELYALGPRANSTILVHTLNLNLVGGLGSQALDGVIGLVDAINIYPFSLLNVGDGDVIDIQTEHVIGVVVTDSYIALSALVTSQVEGVLGHLAGSGDVLAQRLPVNHVGRSVNSEYLAGIAGILTTCPERQGAVELHLGRYQPVVGLEGGAIVAGRGHVTRATVGLQAAHAIQVVPLVAVAIGVNDGPATGEFGVGVAIGVFLEVPEQVVLNTFDYGPVTQVPCCIVGILPSNVGSGHAGFNSYVNGSVGSRSRECDVVNIQPHHVVTVMVTDSKATHLAMELAQVKGVLFPIT